MAYSASQLQDEWDLEPHHAHLIVTCARPPLASIEAALPAADTIGHTDAERMQVRYVASPLDPSVWVMSIVLP